jgi:hypothetical protein
MCAAAPHGSSPNDHPPLTVLALGSATTTISSPSCCSMLRQAKGRGQRATSAVNSGQLVTRQASGRPRSNQEAGKRSPT